MAPMAEWTRHLNAIMQKDFAITLEDAGADAHDIERYRRGEPDAAEFVRWFARKYDLIGAAEWGLAD